MIIPTSTWAFYDNLNYRDNAKYQRHPKYLCTRLENGLLCKGIIFLYFLYFQQKKTTYFRLSLNPCTSVAIDLWVYVFFFLSLLVVLNILFVAIYVQYFYCTEKHLTRWTSTITRLPEKLQKNGLELIDISFSMKIIKNYIQVLEHLI